MTLTERMEFKDLKELKNVKDKCFDIMNKLYGKAKIFIKLAKDSEFYYHLEVNSFYTTGSEKDCYESLLEHLKKQEKIFNEDNGL